MLKWKAGRFDAIDLLYTACGVLVIFMLAFSMVLFTRNAYAGNTTDNISIHVLPGTATLAGSPEINVTVSYTGDDASSNNSIKIEWGLDEVDFTLGSQVSGVHPASPYSYTITSLDNSEVYQIKVTVTDTDNDPMDYVKTLTGLKPYNPLIHNAVSTGSGISKWDNGGAGWGTGDSGSQYGEFSCQTCHERRSGNIKRIRKDWSAVTLPPVPIQSGSETVNFTNTATGFALDDTSGHTTSDRICEACHTQTSHHRYDSSALAGTDHQSGNDCTGCHEHQNAFAPAGGCSACHGGNMSGITESSFWPDSAVENTDNAGSADDSGEHQIHMTRLADKVLNQTLTELLDDADSANKQLQLCNYCHENPGSDGDHMSGDDAEVTRFLQMDGSADGGTAGAYTMVADTCSNVDCHNGKNVLAANNWYAGSSSNCLMCHTEDSTNLEAEIDPASGLHYNSSAGGVLLHDGSFSSSGDCTSCHTTTPSDGHFNAVANTPDSATYNFQSSASIDIKLNTLNDATDGTCAADCHSDGGTWYRLWSQDAFTDPTVVADQPLPANCNVCHGQFGAWAEGTSHYGTNNNSASLMGQSHNSLGNPGTACEDCHVFPSVDLHNNDENLITLNDDDGAAALLPNGNVDAVYDADNDVVYCAPCHVATPLPPDADSRSFPDSVPFGIERITGANIPSGACYSGSAGCHGDTSQNWWPTGDPVGVSGLSKHPGDPAAVEYLGVNYGYPNREGAHNEHNITIGELLAKDRGRSDTNGDGKPNPIQQDYNETCGFCHPMIVVGNEFLSANHYDKNNPDASTIDLFGGQRYQGSTPEGLGVTGPPVLDGSYTYDAGTYGDGYLYQLETTPYNAVTLYPRDTDGSYTQYLYAYSNDSSVNHGTCSQISCHSNAPFTPNWYGDDQAPGLVSNFKAYYNVATFAIDGGNVDLLDDDCRGDKPGTVLLTWNAPGNNGDFDGTAYEYEVYSKMGSSFDLGTAIRAGGVPTILRKDELQCMAVDGLNPGAVYSFGVRTVDNAGNLSAVQEATSSQTAHNDDTAPVFFGLNMIQSHDEEGALNLSWDSAKDHSVPVTYRVWYTQYSLKNHLSKGGQLEALSKACYDATEPPNYVGNSGGAYCIVSEVTQSIHLQITGLQSGDLYNFLTRAYDLAGNHDLNSVVQMALPKSAPQEQVVTKMFLANSSSMDLNVEIDLANPGWLLSTTSVSLDANDGSFGGADTYIFAIPSGGGLARQSEVNGISFDIQMSNPKRDALKVSAELGTWNGSTFTRLTAADGSPISDTDVVNNAILLGKKASRLQKFSLAAYAQLLDQNERLAVRLFRWDSSSSDPIFTFGTLATKGQLLANVQPYNHPPTTDSLNLNATYQAGGYIDINWTPVTDPEGHVVHYDIYGSADDGADGYPYVIATGLTNSDPAAVRWDTVGDGLISTHNFAVKADVGDGYQFEESPEGSGVYLTHAGITKNVGSNDNSVDVEKPAPVEFTHVETRPKKGSVYLEWLAVGDDGLNHGTRVNYYDIRYKASYDSIASDMDFDAASKAHAEPVPGFSGTTEHFELLGLLPDKEYTIAIKACDEASPTANCSDLDVGKSTANIKSGQHYCGVCHSTPPDEPDTRGTHREHGYTLDDCAKCHGDGTSSDGNDVTQYDGRHYDGVINIGWARNTDDSRVTMVELDPASGGSGVVVIQNSIKIYEDLDGAGGYNAEVTYDPLAPNENTDSGSCLNFNGAKATGCHGPFEPKWETDTKGVKKVPHCADCHGDQSSARVEDPYFRYWDANLYNSVSGLNDIPVAQIEASPPQANHGGLTDEDRYVGAHEKHLNASFRFAKQDSCRLCHLNTFESGLHANREVDVVFDLVADEDVDTPAAYDTSQVGDGDGISCSSLNNLFCHDTGARWAEPGAKCNSCHGMGSEDYDVIENLTTIGHVRDDKGDVVECIYCHVEGHPQSPDGINPGDTETLLINNNPAIGINYRSGGIHIKRKYAWGPVDGYTSLAEVCWGCHDFNHNDTIDLGETSEWLTNTRTATGSSLYDYGSLNQFSWVDAVWTSGKSAFSYKTGKIQSTHSTDPTGTATVTWSQAYGRYDETLDLVTQIRCSNCHDVHNLNLAPGDTMSGVPYLRGTWQGNPYEEDGAPQAGTIYTAANAFGIMPRAGAGYNQLGGYYIDQNNVKPGTSTPAHYPTSGWTLASSAGLCVLCHGDDVDNMDKISGENLWLGTNGHSNSTLAGTFKFGVNIFDYTHGRPAPQEPSPDVTAAERSEMVLDMAAQSRLSALETAGESSPEIYGYRSVNNKNTMYTPKISANYAYGAFDLGAAVGSLTPDTMYHQFSCSKCHSPHASRLPKLLITNCLDIRHNTWDDGATSTQVTYDNAALTDVDLEMKAAYYVTAQNCHRFDARRSSSDLRGGWNKVTPWAISNNDDSSQEKGAGDWTYKDSSPGANEYTLPAGN